MRWVLFLSRVAFLCGITMLLAFSLLFSNWNKGEVLSTTFITAGYGLGLIIVPFINVVYAVALLLRKKLSAAVPLWLILSNVFWLCLLIAYIFLINDPFYNQ